MYSDHNPDPRTINSPDRVLVIEKGEKEELTARMVVEECRAIGATSRTSAGETFWLVFEEESRRLWDFTRKSLEAEFDNPDPPHLDSDADKAFETKSDWEPSRPL